MQNASLNNFVKNYNSNDEIQEDILLELINTEITNDNWENIEAAIKNSENLKLMAEIDYLTKQAASQYIFNDGKNQFLVNTFLISCYMESDSLIEQHFEIGFEKISQMFKKTNSIKNPQNNVGVAVVNRLFTDQEIVDLDYQTLNKMVKNLANVIINAQHNIDVDFNDEDYIPYQEQSKEGFRFLFAMTIDLIENEDTHNIGINKALQDFYDDNQNESVNKLIEETEQLIPFILNDIKYFSFIDIGNFQNIIFNFYSGFAGNLLQNVVQEVVTKTAQDKKLCKAIVSIVGEKGWIADEIQITFEDENNNFIDGISLYSPWFIIDAIIQVIPDWLTEGGIDQIFWIEGVSEPQKDIDNQNVFIRTSDLDI